MPDFCLLVVGANMGVQRMTKEHISIACALQVRLSFYRVGLVFRTKGGLFELAGGDSALQAYSGLLSWPASSVRSPARVAVRHGIRCSVFVCSFLPLASLRLASSENVPKMAVCELVGSWWP